MFTLNISSIEADFTAETVSVVFALEVPYNGTPVTAAYNNIVFTGGQAKEFIRLLNDVASTMVEDTYANLNIQVVSGGRNWNWILEQLTQRS